MIFMKGGKSMEIVRDADMEGASPFEVGCDCGCLKVECKSSCEKFGCDCGCAKLSCS